MNPTQIKLVQDSFAKVAPISEQAAVMFYDRLFEVAPSVKAMFPDDMTEQRKKLMATLAVVVNGLTNLESVLPAASALAKRHVGYGAKPEHYPVVGGALLSSVLAGETTSQDIELRPASWWRDRGVTLKYGCRATEVDVGRREVKIENEESVPFSKLILTTGSSALRLNVPGADLAGVHTFRDSRDVDLLLTLAAQKKRVV